MRYTSSPSRQEDVEAEPLVDAEVGREALRADRVPRYVRPTHSLGVAAQVRLGCRRCHGERDVASVQEAELGDAVGDGRAARAPGVGPAVDALLEEEPVEDELATTVEQLGQRPLPVRTLEAVVVLDAHHRHALAGRGELVHRGGHGLFALGHGRECRVPLALADDGWTRDGHRSTPQPGEPSAAP